MQFYENKFEQWLKTIQVLLSNETEGKNEGNSDPGPGPKT
jgi:hypothetical protein